MVVTIVLSKNVRLVYKCLKKLILKPNYFF